MMYKVKCESLIKNPLHILEWTLWANNGREARRKVFNKTRGKFKCYVVGDALAQPNDGGRG